MSGPNPPESESEEQEPVIQPIEEIVAEHTGGAETYSQAYSAPEAEHFMTGPYVPADPRLYDYEYDDYGGSAEQDDETATSRWPWVIGVAAIVAAIALVVSVALVVTGTDTDADNLAVPATPVTTSAPPVQDEITPTTAEPPPPPTSEQPPPPPPTSEEPPPPPPVVIPEPPPPAPSTEAPEPATTTPPATTTTTTTTVAAGPRQVTYSVTGTKAPGDIITVTYIDASGRRVTRRNVYIPWSLTVTPISQSEVGSVEASSFFRVSRLNCSITTNDGILLSSNASDAPQTSC